MHLCLSPPGVSATTQHTRCVFPPLYSGGDRKTHFQQSVLFNTRWCWRSKHHWFAGTAWPPQVVVKVKHFGGVGWLVDRLKSELSWWEKHATEFKSTTRSETQGATQLWWQRQRQRRPWLVETPWRRGRAGCCAEPTQTPFYCHQTLKCVQSKPNVAWILCWRHLEAGAQRDVSTRE